MIGSKILPFAKLGLGLRNSPRLFSLSAARKGGPFIYRDMPIHNSKDELFATACGTFMWWWVFWHLFTDYHHVIGHYEFPDAASWTDEELGVPPDEADDPE